MIGLVGLLPGGGCPELIPHLLLVEFDDADGAEVRRELCLSGARRDALDVHHVGVRELEGHGVRIIRL